MRLAAAVLVPLALLGGAELALRVAGAGHPTSFYLPLAGRDALTTNPRFGWRFFPPTLARTPQVQVVAEPKPEGTIRVLVLGGSAAMGTPDPAYGLARTLDAVLASALPERRVEVLNLAMTAINSWVVREIAVEAAGRVSPDVVVVYLGNNEIVGPYGPGTVFSPLASRPVIRLGLLVRSLRIGQVMESAMRRLGGGGAPEGGWQGMEMFTGHEVESTDPRLEAVRRSLRANLEEIVEAARRGGADVVLSTVAVNLLDCPPFASAHRPDLGADELASWEETVARGAAAAEAGDHRAAVEAFTAAVEIDDAHAELRYRLGRSLLSLGRVEEARGHLEAARDLDTLRFRATAALNHVIREVASDGGVSLVDGEQVLGAAAAVPDLPGDDLFFEHVHLRFAGTHLLASAVAEAVLSKLQARSDLGRRAELPTREAVAARLALTDRDRARLEEAITRMTARPPFTAQLGHAARLQERYGRVLGLRRQAEAQPGAAVAAHRRAVAADPTDLEAREALAALLHDVGELDESAVLWRGLLEEVPETVDWLTKLGFVLLDDGQGTAAESVLRHVTELRPRFPEAWVNLGTALERSGDEAGALAAYERALELDPVDLTALLDQASLRARQGRLEEALALYRSAEQADPASGEAVFGAATVLERMGRSADAEAAYRRALETDPLLAKAANNLGWLLAGEGQPRAAEAAYRRALAVAPDHVLARLNLADLLLETGRPAAAASEYLDALRRAPDNVQARLNAAVALRLAGREREAAAQYERVLDLAPESSPALRGLADLLASTRDPGLRDPARAAELADRARALVE